MKNILRECKLLKYIDANVESYVTEEDEQALAEIQFAMTSSQVRLTIQSTTAHDAWERIKAKHQHASKSNRIFLKNQFLGLQMKEKETITEFISRVDDMAEQVTALSEEKVTDEDKSLVLIRGVNDSYKSNVLAIQEGDKLDNYEHVTTSLLNEEMRRNEKSGNNNNNGKQENAFYTNCGRNNYGRYNRGHRGRNNYNNYNNQGNNDQSNQSTTKFEGNCRFCNKYGHKEIDCRTKKRGNSNHQRGHNQSYANYGNHSDEKNEGTSSYLFLATATATAYIASEEDKYKWIIDSGASNHMTPHREMFTTYECFNGNDLEIKLGDHSKIYAKGKGTIEMELNVNDKQITGTISNVLHVPELRTNLFSIDKALSRNLTIEWAPNKATFLHKKLPIMTASKRGTMFFINGSVIRPEVNIAIDEKNESKTWHERLGHIGIQNLQHMAKNKIVNGLPEELGNLPFCEDCAMNKLTRVKFPHSKNHSNYALKIVHSDLCGPMKTQTPNGSKYFLTFIDDYSRKAHVYFIKNKNETFDKFLEFKAMVENQTNRRIQILRSDRGGEYVNEKFRDYLRQYGIRHQTTAPYSPQQNGIAERFNRTVVEMARTMINSAKMPDSLWAEAVNTAAYIRNHCISKALGTLDKTPEELWSKNKPDVSHLRKFGCVAYALINQHQHKFQEKGKICLFLGYETDSKAY
jgi:gag-polypeptide of LTR copia-type/Integrase core domain/GAG-pre-integrase domain